MLCYSVEQMTFVMLREIICQLRCALLSSLELGVKRHKTKCVRQSDKVTANLPSTRSTRKTPIINQELG